MPRAFFYFMAKDPAVLFYTSDFLSGTFTMDDAQVGKYIRLLCLQHQKGKLTEKDMLSICKAYDVEIWDKFKVEDGYYYNERMYNETIRRQKFSESRRNNAKSPKKESTSEAYAEHMETETENRTITKTKVKTKLEIVLPFESEEFSNYWTMWKDFKKKQFKFTYATPQSEQAALKDLVKLSNGDEQTALQIIEQSLAKGWKGFFALKTETYATGTNSNHKPSFSEREWDALKNL